VNFHEAHGWNWPVSTIYMNTLIGENPDTEPWTMLSKSVYKTG